jgi:hypothetical protein
MAPEGGGPVSRIYPPALGIFLILLGSSAYFWHSRDWNTGSRLMLTYALVDRGTVAITGLEHQTGDLAWFRGQYYSDKLPGYSFLAAVPYAVLKWVFHFPSHPLDTPEMPFSIRHRAPPHWPADYWITLGTSGLLTAWTGALLVLLARDLGCAPGVSALVGLAYGLSTPAYVYATLAYGHQASAFALLGSFLLIWKKAPRLPVLRLAASGFLAALASVIELQMGPVSAILGLYLLVEVVRRRYPFAGLLGFAAGAMIPTLALLAYNQTAFDSPWDMGYFHEVNFAPIHPRDNPTGLRAPDWTKLGPLLWGCYRGLFVYAPILILAGPGWVVLLWRRRWALAIVSFLVCASVLLVNLGYPQWTGGWSTGPRLLVPLIPFAMIPVAGLLAEPGRWGQAAVLAATILALIGGVEMLLFQGAGGRIPHEVWDAEGRRMIPLAAPLRDAVWPLWTGEPLPPPRRYIDGFARNLMAMAAPEWAKGLAPRWRFLQMLPLVLAQCLTIAILMLACSRSSRGRHPG